ncbi:MAG: dynamin family protein [Synergistaceae bacterium]|jgi:predicted GTPase|nr:dynamin family protein [Synergistaceae bacterium]
MAEIKQILDELEAINERYKMDNDSIIEYLDGMDEELLCVPIIGAFSSGKSAAINTLLGYSQKILKENITPETAVPTEIQYRFRPESADDIYIYYTDAPKEHEIIGKDEYLKTKRDNLDYSKVANIRLSLEHKFFAEIRHIMLVDMPGFGSGDDVHDKAINDYVDNSMAYIIAFPANDMTMRDGVGDILRELCVLDKPICVMITKIDQAPPQKEFDAAFAQLQKNLAKYIGNREIKGLMTSSKQGKIDDLKNYLRELEVKSEELLFKQKFLPFFEKEANKTLAYLRALLEKSGLSESELKEQEERLNADMERLMSKANEFTKRFQNDTLQCAEEIVSDVQIALNNELDSYIAMAMNQTDAQRISESINSTVRLTVNSSFQQRFTSKAQKYVDSVSAEIAVTDSFIAGISGETEQSGASLGEALGASAVGGAGGAIAGGLLTTLAPGVAGVLTAIGGSLGLAPIVIGSLSIPVVGIVLAALGVIGGILASVFSGDKKREESRAKLRQQFVSTVFPSVLNQLLPTVQTTLREKTEEIRTAIESQIKERKEVLQKAISDCGKKQADEAGKSAQVHEEIRKDISIVEGMRSAI